MERMCSKHHNTICDKTKCAYGPRFLRTDVSMTVSQAEVKYGMKWLNLPHEMTTTVMHDSRDSNGSNFHCGHVRYTKDTCRCFCSNKGGNQISKPSLVVIADELFAAFDAEELPGVPTNR